MLHSVLVAQLCPNSHNPMDCSLQNHSVHVGFSETKCIEWVSIPFSKSCPHLISIHYAGVGHIESFLEIISVHLARERRLKHRVGRGARLLQVICSSI